ncbi:MAG TPA: hypothetical protein DHW14_04075 [Clostridiales bacterium]|nr:hypothetical protein [Clostridiales bacterium]
MQAASRVVPVGRALEGVPWILPDQPVLSVCSCCPWCCYQLGMLLTLGRRDLVLKSDYVAVLDEDLCDACGECALPEPSL